MAMDSKTLKFRLKMIKAQACTPDNTFNDLTPLEVLDHILQLITYYEIKDHSREVFNFEARIPQTFDNFHWEEGKEIILTWVMDGREMIDYGKCFKIDGQECIETFDCWQMVCDFKRQGYKWTRK